MRNKRIFSAVLASLCLIGATGCSKSNDTDSSSSSSKASTLKTDAVVSDQLQPPQQGEEIAVFNVEGYGSFSCRLFKQAAPKACENFITLAKEGKYNGVPFHRVIEDFMVQGGDTTLIGGDGKSIYGDGFAVELNESLHHYDGALAVARSSSYALGQSTQFYVVSSQTAKSLSDIDFDETQQQLNNMHKKEGQNDLDFSFSSEVRQNYKSVGGYPSLDMSYTVFGQTFKGRDVVEKISKCSKDASAGSDGTQSTPDPQVTLTSVEITTYNG